MGLKQVFESDPADYALFWREVTNGPIAACHVDPATGEAIGEVVEGTDAKLYQASGLPGALACIRYGTPPLGTPPLGRSYAEEVTTPGSTHRPGAVWGTANITEDGPGEVHFIASVNTIVWPSWTGQHWTFASATGRRLRKLEVPTLGAGLAASGHMFVERGGAVWLFNAHVLVDGNSAAIIDGDTALGSGASINAADFPGHAGDGIADFAIDRAADRVWIRWISGTLGCVSVYRLSTHAKLTDIYAPNATNGIALTHDGFLYLADALEWLCVYDYEGRLRGAMRAPRADAHLYGATYGWDPLYKRLLRLRNTPCATNGASTLRVEGFQPVPEAAILAPPIPRQVPRKGRTVYFFAGACGEGAEAMTGRPATATVGGSPVAVGATDADGDAILPYTPAATGPVTLGITV